MRGLAILALGAGAMYLASQSKKKKKQTELLDVTDEPGGAAPSEEPEELEDESDDTVDEEIGELVDETTLPETGVEDEDLDLGELDPIEQPGPTDPAPKTAIPTPAAQPKRPPRGPEAPGEPVASIYSAEGVFMPPEIADALTADSAASLPENRFYFHLAPRIQIELFDRFVGRFSDMVGGAENPTLPQVVAREELSKINSGSDWTAPQESFTDAQKLVWHSALGLAHLAAINTGFSKTIGPKLEKVKTFRASPNMYTVIRESLGMPNLTMRSKQDKDLIALDQRVEILALSEDKTHAEHIIGRVADLSPNGDSSKLRVEIVDSFQGTDVTPQLSDYHNFDAGSLGIFEKRSPSGIYRVFPKGMA